MHVQFCIKSRAMTCKPSTTVEDVKSWGKGAKTSLFIEKLSPETTLLMTGIRRKQAFSHNKLLGESQQGFQYTALLVKTASHCKVFIQGLLLVEATLLMT